jgi:hypothetical protein
VCLFPELRDNEDYVVKLVVNEKKVAAEFDDNIGNLKVVKKIVTRYSAKLTKEGPFYYKKRIRRVPLQVSIVGFNHQVNDLQMWKSHFALT